LACLSDSEIRPPVQVDVDDLDEDLLAHLKRPARGSPRAGRPAPRCAPGPRCPPRRRTKRAERHQLGDPPRHDLPDLVGPPRNCCHGSSCVDFSDRRDALAVHVHVQDLDRDLLANLDDLARVVECASRTARKRAPGHPTPPRSTNAPKLTIEDTTPLRDLAAAQRVEETCGRTSGLGLLKPGTAGTGPRLLRFLSSSMILASISLADVRLAGHETRRISTSEAGQEAAPARCPGSGRPLTTSITVPVDHAVFFLDLLDGCPRARSYCARLLGQDQAALPLSSF